MHLKCLLVILCPSCLGCVQLYFQVANCIERDPGDSNVDPMSADEFDPMSADECDSGSEYDPSDMEESSDSSGSGDEGLNILGIQGMGFRTLG